MYVYLTFLYDLWKVFKTFNTNLEEFQIHLLNIFLSNILIINSKPCPWIKNVIKNIGIFQITFSKILCKLLSILNVVCLLTGKLNNENRHFGVSKYKLHSCRFIDNTCSNNNNNNFFISCGWQDETNIYYGLQCSHLQ